jgi:hypothetical protein
MFATCRKCNRTARNTRILRRPAAVQAHLWNWQRALETWQQPTAGLIARRSAPSLRFLERTYFRKRNFATTIRQFLRTIGQNARQFSIIRAVRPIQRVRADHHVPNQDSNAAAGETGRELNWCRYRFHCAGITRRCALEISVLGPWRFPKKCARDDRLRVPQDVRSLSILNPDYCATDKKSFTTFATRGC